MPWPQRGPSRKVRLRRTLAGLLLVVVLAAVAIRFVDRQDAADAVDQLPGMGMSVEPPTVPAPSVRTSTIPHAEDGSTTPASSAPSEASIPSRGTGRITVVAVPRAAVASSGRTVRYSVEVEEGLGVDTAAVARTIQSVLLDRRGWQDVDGIRFVNVGPAQVARGDQVDIRVSLVSPALTDKLCAPLRTYSQVSCWKGDRAVLNLRRWVLGDDSYGRDVERYRVYQVNHEVGHGLGHGHEPCPAVGRRAPIMAQQTLNLGGCQPWPYPSGA